LSIASVVAADGDYRLAEAAKKRDKAAIRVLLKQKVDINAAQPDGATALHWAAYWDDVETLDLLIARGASVNVANEYAATPLWVACANRHPAVVQKLIAAGADPNKGLLSGETVLMRCAFTGDPAAVEALLVRGADVNAKEPSSGQTALMWGVANRHPDVTRVLLAHGAAVGARTATFKEFRGIGFGITGSTEFDAGGFTPLLFAARHNDIESASLLLDAGAKVNEKGADGNTALVLAAMSGHGQFATFLLDRGADPNAAGAGYAALHAAVLRADPALVKALLAKGANPNVRLMQGSPVPRQTYQFVLSARDLGATPYALAAKYVEPEILRILAAAGSDPLVPMNDGTTPLMAAVGLGMRRPYSVDRRDRLIAPELIAAEWENEARVLDTVRVAIEAGAAVSVNQSNSAGETALHGAAGNGYKTVVEFLVARGGDLDIKNKSGVTPRELLGRLPASATSR
jgi:ankyrin repeat protein